MKKTIFAVSDIHGHYQLTISALKEAGYDSENDNHLLIVCGDITDRGQESLAVYEWLSKLTEEKKAIVLRGNHDYFLMDFLKGSNNPFNFIHNGLNTTLDDLLHSTNDFGTYVVTHSEPSENGQYEVTIGLYDDWANQTREQILDEYPDLLDWLSQFPHYYETKNYIFTHGSIDTKVEDWHNPTKCRHRYEGWDACHWDDGSFFNESICNTDKTVVIGHFGTQQLRKYYKYGKDDNSEYSILKRNDGKVIALDATTILSKRVNVLKIEDEELIEEEIR